MSGPATFGDFAQATRKHLEALPVSAERPNPDIVARQIRDYNRGLHRILKTMIKYTTDLAASAQPAGDQKAGSQDWWTRAAAVARQSLLDAYLVSPLHLTAGRRRPEVRRTSMLASHLAAAADAMVIGRDLLQTHFTTGADGSRAPRTEWSAVIESAAASRALLTELGGWAREITGRAACLTKALTLYSAMAAAEQQRFIVMHSGLASAAAAIETAQRHAPISKRDLDQLHAIPGSLLIPSRQPSPDETTGGLCQGIIDVAGRVRRVFAAAAPEAAWSPELTADSLRQTAASAAVISHHCQLIQQTLADHATDLGVPWLSYRLRTAARTLGKATQAWLQATRTWKSIQTDATVNEAATTTGIADLVQWTGCLSSGDPSWKPGVCDASPARPGAIPVPARADLSLVADALREVASTMVAVAAADYTRVRTAARTGRLLTPVEAAKPSLEPQLFTRASRYQATTLLDAYRDAGAASVQATAETGEIASKIHDHTQRVSQRQRALSSRAAKHQIANRPIDRQIDAAPPARAAETKAGRDMPGPVERRLREIGVTSPVLLSRGLAIDEAASQLIDEAAHQSVQLRWNAAVTSRKTITSAEQLVDELLARSCREPVLPSPALPAYEPEAQAEPDSPQAEL